MFRIPRFTLRVQYCVTAGKSLNTIVWPHHVIAALYRNIVTRSVSELIYAFQADIAKTAYPFFFLNIMKEDSDMAELFERYFSCKKKEVSSSLANTISLFSGAPNDGFLLNTLKTYFSLSDL